MRFFLFPLAKAIFITRFRFFFHIFSTEAILSAHTNGNIATKDLDSGGQGFGASQSSSLKLNEEHY